MFSCQMVVHLPHAQCLYVLPDDLFIRHLWSLCFEMKEPPRRLCSSGSVGSFGPSSRDPDEAPIIFKIKTHTCRMSQVVTWTKAPPAPFAVADV
jgi:hypothetical protein